MTKHDPEEKQRLEDQRLEGQRLEGQRLLEAIQSKKKDPFLTALDALTVAAASERKQTEEEKSND